MHVRALLVPACATVLCFGPEFDYQRLPQATGHGQHVVQGFTVEENGVPSGKIMHDLATLWQQYVLSLQTRQHHTNRRGLFEPVLPWAL